MLRKVFVVAALALVPALASVASAQFKAGDFELTLGGGGANNRGFTSGDFNAEGSLGYFLSKNLEVSVRQSAAYAHIQPASESWTASTRVAADWHFDLGKWQPFIGGNIGYDYGGRGVKDQWEVAPEAGVKYFLNSSTFIFGLAEYQILFTSNNGAAFNRGSWVYTLGLGLTLN